jgi:hypothetical protein
MLRFLDDACNVSNIGGCRCKYTQVTGLSQATSILGRDGQGFGYWMLNASFGAENHIITLNDLQEPWYWAADIAFFNDGTQTTIVYAAEIWQAANHHTGQIICSMLIDISGHLHFRLGTNTGGPAPIDLAVSSNQFPVSSSALGQQPIWGKLEVQIGAGAFLVHYEGNPIMHGSSGALTLIDTFVWRSPDQNWAIQNHYILDSQPGLTGFLGATRIDSFVPNVSVGGNPWSPVGAATNVLAVSEHGPTGIYPDGDTTYMVPNTVGALQQFGFLRPRCYGLILGLGLNFVCRPTGGGAQIGGYTRPAVTLFQMGSNATLIDSGSTFEPDYPPMFGYLGYQFLSEKDPSNNQAWNDGDIGAAEWGIKALSTGIHCTQFSLMKLVSLDPSKPYTCGGVGSYVW